MTLPLTTLSSLLAMQDDEDHKPRVRLFLCCVRHYQWGWANAQLSKISWLPDILVLRGSIIPTVIGPVLSVTIFAACIAAASLLYGRDVGLTNNVGK